jgi:hypothetical protein
VDEQMATELADAAQAFEDAPKRLQAAILKAASQGDNANKITKAIRQVYSPDYVRRLIRDARKEGKIPPRPGED